MRTVRSSCRRPWEALIVCSVLLFAPALASQRPCPRGNLADAPCRSAWRCSPPTVRSRYAAIALGALLHAVEAWRQTRTGAIILAASALLCLGASAAMAGAQLTAAFLLSCLAVAVRAGVLPFHVGVAALCDRAPVVQAQQLASAIALVFVHLRFVDHHAAAVGAGAGCSSATVRRLLHRRPDDLSAARSARIVSGHDGHARRHAARGHGCREPRELRGRLAGGRRHGTGPWRAGPRHYVARSARRRRGLRRTWRTCRAFPRLAAAFACSVAREWVCRGQLGSWRTTCSCTRCGWRVRSAPSP